MSDWQRVARIDAFPAGERRVLDVDGIQVAVFHIDGHYYAIEDVCTHDGGELASGELIGCEAGSYVVVCPRHGARFDLATGQVRSAPAYSPVGVLPVRLHDGWLEVRDDRWE